MNADTPRTDDKESRIQCDLSSMKLDDWNAAYHEMKEHAQKLEGELTAVTEQRDRLAGLVKQFIYIIDITEESDGGRLFHPTNITSCRAGDLQKIGELVEALRRASRNQPIEP